MLDSSLQAKWFIPTFFGDITLCPLDKDTRTRVTLTDLSLAEKAALRSVLEKGVKKGLWATTNIDADLTAKALDLNAPLATIQKEVTKALKPQRETLSVVKFVDGRIEETREAVLVSEAAAGVSVAVPDRGCPAPAFVKAELKAREVLERFLGAGQLENFRRHNSFVTVGGDTGHFLRITSRQTKAWERFGTLYDLSTDEPMCVHDYSVPAAEEMLAVMLCMSLPKWETHLRELPRHG